MVYYFQQWGTEHKEASSIHLALRIFNSGINTEDKWITGPWLHQGILVDIETKPLIVCDVIAKPQGISCSIIQKNMAASQFM